MKKKKLLFLLLILFASPVWGTTYYVDSSITDTNVASATPDFTTYNPETFSTSTGSASVFKTIADINLLVTVAPGDSVLFRKGQTWRETLLPPVSGTNGNQVTFGSFGSGNRPRILGSVALSSWDQTNLSLETADLLEEGFEATVGGANHFTTAGDGHLDVAGWTGTLGAGSTLDADDITTPPLHGGSQVLKIQKVSPNYTSFASFDLGSEQAVTYTRVVIKITADGLVDTNELSIATAYDGTGIADNNRVWDLRLWQNDGGQMKYRMYYFNQGSLVQSNVDDLGRTVSNWTKLEVLYNHTTHTCEWRIDGTTMATVSIIGGHKTGVRYISLGSTASYTVTSFYDRVSVSSTKYLYDTVTLTANQWKAFNSGFGKAIYFENTDGTIKWGKKEITQTAVDAEYDWFIHPAGYIITYAATDPDSRYTSVETTKRNWVIESNLKAYITISGLDISYATYYGIDVITQTGWIVDDCYIHHIGVQDASEAEGVFINTGTSLWVKNSTIANCGNHGIGITAQNGGTISGVVIENNTFYDNYHSDIDLQNPTGGGAITGAIVRYNYLYNTTDFSYASYGNGGIYVLSSEGTSLSGVQIYYNKFYQKAGTAIAIRDLVTSPVIYNNTIYGALSGSAQYAGGIDIFTLGIYDPTGAVVKNNICMDTRDICFKVDKLAYISSADNNLWYMSAGGTNVYAMVITTYYHFDDQAAYKAATGWDTNGKWQDPLFLSTTNLYLRGSSPSINAGVNVGLTVDYAGTVLPKGIGYDIGAYEYIPMTFTVGGGGSQTFTVGTGSQTFTLQ